MFVLLKVTAVAHDLVAAEIDKGNFEVYKSDRRRMWYKRPKKSQGLVGVNNKKLKWFQISRKIWSLKKILIPGNVTSANVSWLYGFFMTDVKL